MHIKDVIEKEKKLAKLYHNKFESALSYGENMDSINKYSDEEEYHRQLAVWLESYIAFSNTQPDIIMKMYQKGFEDAIETHQKYCDTDKIINKTMTNTIDKCINIVSKKFDIHAGEYDEWNCAINEITSDLEALKANPPIKQIRATVLKDFFNEMKNHVLTSRDR